MKQGEGKERRRCAARGCPSQKSRGQSETNGACMCRVGLESQQQGGGCKQARAWQHSQAAQDGTLGGRSGRMHMPSRTGVGPGCDASCSHCARQLRLLLLQGLDLQQQRRRRRQQRGDHQRPPAVPTTRAAVGLAPPGATPLPCVPRPQQDHTTGPNGGARHTHTTLPTSNSLALSRLTRVSRPSTPAPLKAREAAVAMAETLQRGSGFGGGGGMDAVKTTS